MKQRDRAQGGRGVKGYWPLIISWQSKKKPFWRLQSRGNYSGLPVPLNCSSVVVFAPLWQSAQRKKNPCSWTRVFQLYRTVTTARLCHISRKNVFFWLNKNTKSWCQALRLVIRHKVCAEKLPGSFGEAQPGRKDSAGLDMHLVV